MPKLVYFAAALAAAAAAQPPERAAEIRTTTRLVQVSVLVHDKRGPVTGLKAKAFLLLDNGRKRDIAFFSEDGKPSSAHRAELLPGVFSNSALLGSTAGTTVILLDAINTHFEDQVRARRALVKFLSQLQLQDRVAIFLLGQTLTVVHDFTSDPKELARKIAATGASSSLDASIGSWLEANGRAPQDADAGMRANVTMQALQSLANHVAPLPGRKNPLRTTWTRCAM